MALDFKKTFGKGERLIIGSLHFSPLLGFAEFQGYKDTLKMAIQDLKAYEGGSVDALFLENNYGGTGEKITATQAIAMGYLISEIRKLTKLTLGVSVLWNDYEAAFALAKTYNLQFIRIPVFVDVVEPYCGVIKGNASHVQKVRKDLGAEDVVIMTDILVKHSKHISTHSLATAAKKAIKAGSDAVIVTGDWTGQAPTSVTVADLRKKINNFPIIVGSGADVGNVTSLLNAGANGVIVSTSLKAGAPKNGERNVKSFDQRVLKTKVKKFVEEVRANKSGH